MGRAYQNKKESMAKTAGQKTRIYSRYGKEIYVVAKQGGVEPDGNLSLRRLIERAKKDQVPAHVIERAIEKAKGSGGEDYDTARYEGFGPGNCMVIVDCLTDNVKRTFTEVRQAFVKNDAKLGSPGTVGHMFDHQAVFVFAGDDEDAILELLMMADVDVSDVELEDGLITVYAPHTEYFKVKTALTDAMPDINFEFDNITFVPQDMVKVEGEDVAMFEKFVAALEDCDDVQNVYHNAEIDE
ncbi:YebC/PmpR family DNA-binding transcriptional regulator [Shewanella glacialipiscicola]|uniref:Probable transcriptional regulatory protein GCM10025855_24120 n=1 Tax=Shewanella glacialipiscicola TaxID=614069 RepID=A0ABQ6J6L0_9GAMM|nr:YebC/PmpR family DNA-binding transcriptional regulator [Shewanella glacialipiscicola]MCL1084999.1 YebC/PmpR family DNA-binding transcriptional regulator [Shewanella glacialipiscicola]MCU7994998.1 YebC/PmpR family DNA-binding transcriptional regulator [Shewanella glacialipiscicola]MCU8026406.1 YebC/PmpR family DNA-binding transcriptional regulator [Shewanella glacialipiscicola]GIU10556.1 putative transcriptional regulatory protein [Shewanella glacialipiscicola]GMA82879.1 putative transcripti